MIANVFGNPDDPLFGLVVLLGCLYAMWALRDE
jgi:hypothetical protein